MQDGDWRVVPDTERPKPAEEDALLSAVLEGKTIRGALSPKQVAELQRGVRRRGVRSLSIVQSGGELVIWADV